MKRTCIAIALLLSAPAWANPIPWPPPASMPLEDMTVEIVQVGTKLHARFEGDFTFDYIPADVTAMLFPVPPDSSNIVVTQDGVPLEWTWSDELYPTVLPEFPTIPMIRWSGPFPERGVLLHVGYEHDLIQRPGEFIFFYANGTGKYFPTYEKTTTAYFDITYPLGHLVNGVHWDDWPYAYQVDGYHLGLTVQSQFGPIVHDVIVSLIPDAIGGADCNNNDTPDAMERTDRHEFIAVPSPLGTENADQMIAADLNNDGLADLISCLSTQNTIMIRQNLAGGSFTPPVAYPVRSECTRLGSGDLDSDGDIDLIVSHRQISDASLLLNNGDGTFAPYSVLTTCLGCMFGAARDLDGDLDVDLVFFTALGSNTNAAQVLINNGELTFAAPQTYSLPMYVQSVVCEDFSGDGKPDLAMSCSSLASSLVLLLNDGAGRFLTSRTILTGRYLGPIAAGRLDFSPSMDLAVTDSRNTVTIMRNQGSGTFIEGPTYGIRPNPHKIQVADLDGSGRADLLIAGADYGTPREMEYRGGVTVLMNRGGQCNFEPGRDVSGLARELGSLLVADLFGDNYPDLLVTPYYGSAPVAFENSRVALREPDTDRDGVMDSCDLCSCTIDGIPIGPTGCYLFPMADFDLDGDVDETDCQSFIRCATGPARGPVNPDCGETDLDRDGDVDQADFGLLQQCFSGENIWADSPCTLH